MNSDQKAGWTFMVNGRLTTVCAAARPNESAVVHRCTSSSLRLQPYVVEGKQRVLLDLSPHSPPAPELKDWSL
jgi:hypothetical protein